MGKMSEETKRKLSIALKGSNNPFFGKKHSEETKRLISLHRKGKCTGKDNAFYGKKHPPHIIEIIKNCERPRGKNHPNWISDRTKLKPNSPGRWEGKLSYEYLEWMRQVKNRDYWQCLIANNDCSGRVEAHHILPWRDHPELRYQINNGITLCHFHHPRKRVDEERYAEAFKKLVAAKMK